MKKVYLLSFFVLVLLFISACSKELKNVSVCGDGKCDDTENCNCQDCSQTPTCQAQQQLQTSCDDQNACTEDLFNQTLNTCQHKTIKNCCGNKVCELDERDCDFTTYQTKCVSDCKLNCPAHLLIQKTNTLENKNDQYPLVCADTNCKQTGDTTFEMRQKSALKATLINNGELTSNLISSSFTCYKPTNPTNKVTTDRTESFGITFRDYFNNDPTLDIVQVNSRIIGNNFATYLMEFDANALQIDNTEITCTINLVDSADNFANTQIINIVFRK